MPVRGWKVVRTGKDEGVGVGINMPRIGQLEAKADGRIKGSACFYKSTEFKTATKKRKHKTEIDKPSS